MSAMKIASADGVRVAYRVTGSGKPVLCFIHGFCCDQSYWDAQVRHFAQQYQVITIDLAGHGESGLNRRIWTGKAFGNDVVAVIGKLDLDRVILVGHSMGGPVAIEAALQMPARVIGVVGVDTFRNVEWARDLEQQKTFIASLHSDFVGTMRQFAKHRFLTNSDPGLVEKVAADMSAAPPRVALGIQQDWFLKEPALASAFEEVTAPIRCIASDSNRIDAEAARRHALSFRVAYISNVGHFLMMEDPDTFNRILDETVKELSSQQSWRMVN